MDTIVFEDYLRLDMRVGEIESAEKLEWSEKLVKLQVDFGELGKKQVLSGILHWYQPEDLVGRQAVFVVNLPEKNIKNEVSQAMILTAFDEQRDTLSIINVDKRAINGTKIY